MIENAGLVCGMKKAWGDENRKYCSAVTNGDSVPETPKKSPWRRRWEKIKRKPALYRLMERVCVSYL
jgi:hypothetical protein